MNYTEINNKLAEIDTENNIWVIYIVIIILSWYSNSLEKKYFLNNDLLSKNKYREILIFIFSILVIIYFYFLKSSIDSINELNEDDSEEKINLVYLSFIGSLLIFISGLIYLYIAVNDEDISVELAFN